MCVRLLLLFTLCTATQNIGQVDAQLDPDRIGWWRTKWAPAPIQLSVNNRGQASSVTFFLSPATSIANGVLEVSFPVGFTLPASSLLYLGRKQ